LAIFSSIVRLLQAAEFPAAAPSDERTAVDD